MQPSAQGKNPPSMLRTQSKTVKSQRFFQEQAFQQEAKLSHTFSDTDSDVEFEVGETVKSSTYILIQMFVYSTCYEENALDIAFLSTLFRRTFNALTWCTTKRVPVDISSEVTNVILV